jgi:hypothetical protein
MRCEPKTKLETESPGACVESADLRPESAELREVMARAICRQHFLKWAPELDCDQGIPCRFGHQCREKVDEALAWIDLVRRANG